MNKRSLILIVLLALIVSACASDALAKVELESLKGDAGSHSTAHWEAIVRYYLENPQTNFSGDDLYDPATGAVLRSFHKDSAGKFNGGYSGDDAYDPAAVGLGE